LVKLVGSFEELLAGEHTKKLMLVDKASAEFVFIVNVALPKLEALISAGFSNVSKTYD